MAIAALDGSHPNAALLAHLRARADHVGRLRQLVRSVPAYRLPSLTVPSGQDGVDLTKLRRGAYAMGIRGLTQADVLILMACAVSDAASAVPVFSHGTADAIWDLPTIGSRCGLVEYLLPPGARGRTPNVRRRRSALSSTAVQVGGLYVTPYERTLVDHGRHARLESAVSVCDEALHLGRTTREALLAELDRVPKGARGRRMAQLAIHLADGRAESPLESLSRTRMFQYGLPMPALQQEFFDAADQIGRTDFYWAEFGLVGESDGDLKYAVTEGDSGKAAVEALLREKKRERRLRQLPEIDNVARWEWSEALPPGRLHAVLASFGLRTVLDGGWPVPDGPLPKRAFFC